MESNRCSVKVQVKVFKVGWLVMVCGEMLEAITAQIGSLIIVKDSASLYQM